MKLPLYICIFLIAPLMARGQQTFFTLDLEDRHARPVGVHTDEASALHIAVTEKDQLRLYSYNNRLQSQAVQTYSMPNNLKDPEVLATVAHPAGHTLYTLSEKGEINRYSLQGGRMDTVGTSLNTGTGIWLSPVRFGNGLRVIRALEDHFLVYDLSPQGHTDTFPVFFEGISPLRIFSAIADKNERFVLTHADADFPKSGLAVSRTKIFSQPAYTAAVLDANDHTAVFRFGTGPESSFYNRLSWHSDYVRSSKISGNSYLLDSLLIRVSVDTDEMLSVQMYSLPEFALRGSRFMYPKDPWMVNGLLLEQVQERGKKNNFQPVKDYSKFLKRLKGNMLVTAEYLDDNILLRIGSLYKEYIPTSNFVSPGIGFSAGGYPGGMMMTPTYREVITQAYFKTLFSINDFKHIPGVSNQTAEEVFTGFFDVEIKDTPDRIFALNPGAGNNYFFYVKKHRKLYGMRR